MQNDRIKKDLKSMIIFQLVKLDRKDKNYCSHIKYFFAESVEDAKLVCKKIGYKVETRRRFYYKVGPCASIDALLGIFKKEKSKDKKELKELEFQIKELEGMKKLLESDSKD